MATRMAPLVTASVINPIPGNRVIRRISTGRELPEIGTVDGADATSADEFEVRLDKGCEARRLLGQMPQTAVVFIEKAEFNAVTAGYR